MPHGWQDSRWARRGREIFLPVESGRTVPVLLLCATVAVAPWSVSLIGLFLVLTLATALALGPRLRLERWRRFPPILWPVLAFVAWSILSALMARDPVLSFLSQKKLFLFVLLPCALLLWDRASQWTGSLVVASIVAVVSASVGIVQFFHLPPAGGLRVHGLMGHHMTFSGQMMLVVLTAVVFIAARRGPPRRWTWFLAAVALLCGTALLLSLTRSNWLGLAAGVLLALTLLRPRWLLPLPVLALALFLAAPEPVRDRIRHLFDTTEAGNAARIDMIHTGLRIVRDRPLVGVGPRMIERTVYDYGADSAILPCFYQHLHNNVIQLAAERGLPALLCWFWFLGRIVLDHGRWFFRLRRSGRTGRLAYPVTALAATLALFVSGMFEYNFGDSEVLLPFLALVGGAYLLLYQDTREDADAPA